MNLKNILAFVSIFLFFIFLNIHGAMATPISSCAILNASSQYELTTDLINQTGFTVGSNTVCFNANSIVNTTFDCNGYKIDGVSAGFSYGIWFNGASNVTFKNCIVSDWWVGAEFDNSNYNNLDNVTFFNSGQSVYFPFAFGSSFNVINNSVFSSEILLYHQNHGSGNVIANSIINTDIASYAPHYDYIYNNTFNSTNPYQIFGTNCWLDYLNNSVVGNLWLSPNNDGFSQINCTDANRDGICDNTSYVFYCYYGGVSSTDYLPRSTPSAYTPFFGAITTPQNTTYRIGNNIEFTATIDLAGSVCFVDFGIGNFTMTNSTGNWHYSDNSISAGTYTPMFWCNTTSGKSNSTIGNVFTMHTPPVIDPSSITGQLVITLGFGIMGLFAILTFLGFGYMKTTGKPDPNTLVKMMIAIVIIVLAIVAVWQGLILPP